MQNHHLHIVILLFFSVYIFVNSNTIYNEYNPLFVFAISSANLSDSIANNVSLPSGNPYILRKYFMKHLGVKYFSQDRHPVLIFVNVDGFNKSYLFFNESRKSVMNRLEFFNKYKLWMSFMSFNIKEKESIHEQFLENNIYSSQFSSTNKSDLLCFSGDDAITRFKRNTSNIFKSLENSKKIMTVHLDLQIDQLYDLLEFMKDDNTIKSCACDALVFIFSTNSSIRSQSDENISEIDSSDSHFFDLYSITSPPIWMIFMGVFIFLSLIIFAILWISSIQVPYYSFKRD